MICFLLFVFKLYLERDVKTSRVSLQYQSGGRVDSFLNLCLLSLLNITLYFSFILFTYLISVMNISYVGHGDPVIREKNKDRKTLFRLIEIEQMCFDT